jgi:hypothetical protein
MIHESSAVQQVFIFVEEQGLSIKIVQFFKNNNQTPHDCGLDLAGLRFAKPQLCTIPIAQNQRFWL